MIRQPPRSTLDRSSAASDVYKRQVQRTEVVRAAEQRARQISEAADTDARRLRHETEAVSYTHLRAHETVLDLVCRLLLEKQNNNIPSTHIPLTHNT